MKIFLGAMIGALLSFNVVAEPGNALKFDDASIVRQMPGAGADYKMPERVFSADLISKLRGSDPLYRKFLYRSIPRDAQKWTKIPLGAWPQLISDIAPVSLMGNTGNPATVGICPFTGKMFPGTEMSDEDFVSKPSQVKVVGTQFVIYENEADMPPGYAVKPNHTEKIPHLDGSIREYRFYIPEQYKNAGPEFMSNRKNWLCPAGEVWRCRMKKILSQVIPDLTAAIVLNMEDKGAVKTLAVVLDRLAEVYPGLPLYTSGRAHGFARSPDGKNYLTAAQYRSIAAKQPFINAASREDYPFWYREVYDFSYDKTNHTNGGWTDATMDQLGWIASAFDLIKDKPETIEFSKMKYGSADGWEKHFRERCLKELEFLALATPPTRGNTSYAYICGSIKAGIACQNQALFRKGLEIIELYIYNNWFPDGMAGDAAYNYATMTQSGIIGLSWMTQLFGGVDIDEKYPLKKLTDKIGCYPINTLYGIPSKHADQHAMIFRALGDGPNPKNLQYAKYEASQSLPFYGLTALRGGIPGRRLELIINHQNAFQHAHRDRLGYQLYYEGVDCVPDFGYCIGYIDPAAKPWSEIKTGYQLMGLPNADLDRWGPWKRGFADMPEAHNILMVDHWLYDTVPCRILAFAGAKSASSPNWWAQFADTDGAGLFSERPNRVSVYRRQLAVLTLPGGSPLVIDVFRVAGGARHDMFWYVPAERSPNITGKGEPQKAAHFGEYQGLTNYNYDVLTGKSIQFYGRGARNITDLTRYQLPLETWYNEWLIKPSKAFPSDSKWGALDGNWSKLLHDVSLGMWSFCTGSAANSEIIFGKAPLPGTLAITDPATGRKYGETVGLKDALDYRIITRKAPRPGLESVFANAIEARTPEQVAEVKDVKITRPNADKDGGILATITLNNGGAGVFASTLNANGKITADSVTLTGRMGAIFPDAFRMSLVDGTDFAALGWKLRLQPGWKMNLASVAGDLTGKPMESALLVQSAETLPVDGTLKGEFVYVQHRANSAFQSVYTIEKISRAEGDLWRIDLSGVPPFIIQRANVVRTDKANPRKLERTFGFMLLSGNTVNGQKIRFPRSSFETSLTADGNLAQTPVPGQIIKGDPFVVYTIQAGDTVTIPSRFACSGERQADGSVKLTLRTTGPAQLSIPGKFNASPQSSAKSVKATVAENNTLWDITSDALNDGTANIVLR